ncbi:ribosomal L7Ae/L30e/S12e/Gadd45 family protein [Candidatus Pacearchaeota archaeon]|nr:ribosomal L7Ae/L30e/S12e/Gadd45 family protein [Candidatus Pacearchaeota archaeon]
MDFYSTIEQARKSGKIEKGINEVTKAIERGTAKAVFYAKDVEPKEIVAHLPALCKERGIECNEADSKAKLGAAAGINVPCSAIAIVEASETRAEKPKAERARAEKKAEKTEKPEKKKSR